MTADSFPRVSAAELRRLLADGQELALLDVRETDRHNHDGHILLSVTLPLSQLELRVASLVPRRSTRTVVYDGDRDGLALRAATRLAELGYDDVSILEGGAPAWGAAGFELFTGTHVIGKAFGEFVEAEYGTRHLSAAEVKRRLDAGENLVVIDSRPVGEFRNFSIPGAIDLPGAEIVHRFHEAVPDPETLVVVNCAGRTRSIIGAQALINAGVPNPVASLADGTMAWLLEGYALDNGKSNLGAPPQGTSLDEARKAAARLTERFSIRAIDAAELARFRADADRSVFVLDVRTEEEFEAGHLPGSRHAAGGQLVQQVGHWVGTRNSRIVLVDDADGVRAAITASWLIQINWAEVYVLRDAFGSAPEGTLEHGPVADPLAAPLPQVETISLADLRAHLGTDTATVFDLDTSVAYEAGHIPGAHFVLRSRLQTGNGDSLPGAGAIVLTSSDGILATFAAPEVARTTDRQVLVLTGGTATWRAAGLELETGPTSQIHPPEDVARNAYAAADRFAAFREYLAWEIQLAEQLKRDGTTDFRVFPPAATAKSAVAQAAE